MLEIILAENALNVEIGSAETLKSVYLHALICDRAGANFEPVHMCEGSGLARTGACDHGLAVGVQVNFSGQRGVHRRDLGAGVQQKVRCG